MIQILTIMTNHGYPDWMSYAGYYLIIGFIVTLLIWFFGFSEEDKKNIEIKQYSVLTIGITILIMLVIWLPFLIWNMFLKK